MTCAADDIAQKTLDIYSSLRFRPANDSQYTILASITLKSDQVPHTSDLGLKVISLATGAKCLPESRLSSFGDTVHDSHAEILARRGFIRWLLEEVKRSAESGFTGKSGGCDVPSLWIERDDRGQGNKWRLIKGVTLHLYISTLPCGDASTRTLSLVPQDPEIAALKNAQMKSENQCKAQSSHYLVPTRGRDNYSLLGVLRTKPGRADSEPSLSMSCSDKIARWSILGIQGALLATLFDPIYIDEVVIGGVDDVDRTMVREDCARAFWKRIDHECLKDVPSPFALHPPAITFTAVDFPFSRVSLENRLGSKLSKALSSTNECLCWISDSNRRPKFEILINGLRRGVDEKQRLKSYLRPSLSKISLLTLYQETLVKLYLPPLKHQTTYYEAKLTVTAYQKAKEILSKNNNGPFAGWIVSGQEWENFTIIC